MLHLGCVTYNLLKDWDLETIIRKLEEVGYEARILGERIDGLLLRAADPPTLDDTRAELAVDEAPQFVEECSVDAAADMP